MSLQIDKECVEVVSPEEMDDEDFTRHMNRRHRDSLGGLPELWVTCDPYVTACWRAFHRQLHKFRIYRDHEHG